MRLRSKKFRENYVDTLGKLYEYSTMMYSERQLSKMADSAEGGYTYAEFKKACDSLSKKLTQYGIGAGDKVAILSGNMPQWTVAFFSTVAFGRISVPILPDSSENEVSNILKHSDSKVLFVSKRLKTKVSQECLDRLTLVIDIETFETIKKDDEKFTCDGKATVPVPDDIATIIYTSGTTGSAKGVVLTHRNFCATVKASYHSCKRDKNDKWLSILPMPHTYELSIGVLYPIYCGACVYYMSKPPVPALLMKAMNEVKPTTILSVPLIIEKVIRNSVFPTIKKSRTLSWLQKNMPWLLYMLIGFKLKKSFGGKVDFFGIGGAKLDSDIEAFLLKCKFPYAIGYGLTETAPLLSQATKKLRTAGSIGIPVRGVELKIHNMNPDTGEGEIIARGDNVMLGYYKDPARTKSVFTEDGWFRTNDLACRDEKGRYYIKGRLNNMILGPSGENIYPEEIEKVINDIDGVNESIVMERNGRLVALVTFNENFIDWNHQGEEELYAKLEEYKQTILKKVNRNVSKASTVSSVEVLKEPFEKTATQKIRRFLYKDVEGVKPKGKGKEKNNDSK